MISVHWSLPSSVCAKTFLLIIGVTMMSVANFHTNFIEPWQPVAGSVLPCRKLMEERG